MGVPPCPPQEGEEEGEKEKPEEWKKKEEVGEARTAASARSPWQPAG
jgi:hypothetical protein